MIFGSKGLCGDSHTLSMCGLGAFTLTEMLCTTAIPQPITTLYRLYALVLVLGIFAPGIIGSTSKTLLSAETSCTSTFSPTLFKIFNTTKAFALKTLLQSIPIRSLCTDTTLFSTFLKHFNNNNHCGFTGMVLFMELPTAPLP